MFSLWKSLSLPLTHAMEIIFLLIEKQNMKFEDKVV